MTFYVTSSNFDNQTEITVEMIRVQRVHVLAPKHQVVGIQLPMLTKKKSLTPQYLTCSDFKGRTDIVGY